MGALSTLALMGCTNNDDNSEWYGSEGIVFTTAIQSRVSGNTWNANDESRYLHDERRKWN